MIYRGTWDSATNYVIGDLVLWNFNYYLANTNNTNSQPPSVNWQIFTVIQSVAYIIATFISLNPTRIWIFNQDYKFPTDPNLFVVIEYKGGSDYASNSRRTGSSENMQEEITALTKETYTINILSKNEEARLSQQRIRASLTSLLAEQQQEIFQYRIGEVSKTIFNLSELEGSGIYNRFAFDISLLVGFAENRSINYFDQFSDEVLTDNNG